MITSIIFMITIFAYSIIASQSFMYILALKDVQLKLEVNAYTESRKLIDISMRKKFTYVVYGALLTNLLLIILTIKDPESIIFIAAVVAFLALVTDTLLTLKGNLPINDIINKWSPDHFPENWRDYRKKWFQIFHYRQIANITGFLSLLSAAIFR